MRVYTTEVFTAFAALYDFRLATLMAFPLAGVAALASRCGARICSAADSLREPIEEMSGRLWSDTAQRIGVAGTLMGAIALVACRLAPWPFEARGARSAYGDALALPALRNSFLWSAAGASLVMMIGILLGYWRAKRKHWLGHAADGLWVALFAIPATITGIGTIALWNQARNSR